MRESRSQTVRTAIVDGYRSALDVDWIGIPTLDFRPFEDGLEEVFRGASFVTIRDGGVSRIVDLS